MPRPLSQALEDHVVPWREHPWPVRWERVFDRRAPLVLEIGFGNGEFLARCAAADPARDYVGIELSWSGATRLFKRLDATGARNARALLVDAEVALAHLFAPGSLDEVFVLHPCPWPKARHVRRRVLAAPGLALLASRMRSGARLTVITDHAEYAAWLAEVLESQELLVSRHPTTEAPPIPGHEPTKYQRKAIAQGVPIHYFEWHRAEVTPAGAAPAPEPPPAPSQTMPSLTLRGDVPFDDLAARFRPRTFRERHAGVEVTARLVNLYRRADGEAWLVEALVQEDSLRQEFAILVVQRAPDELLVKLSGLGRPHPTHGVKRAVHCVGAWLREALPGLVLARENLGAAGRAPARQGEEG